MTGRGAPLGPLRGGEPAPGASPHVAMPEVALEVLEALVLPWAKLKEPAKYQMTLGVRAVPGTYRKYLMRLAELRWAADPAARTDFPLSVLEASGIVAQVRHRPTGKVLTVKGRQATPRTWAWIELLLTREEFERVLAVKEAFDLEIVE